MRVIEKNIFKIEELSDKAQEFARSEWLIAFDKLSKKERTEFFGNDF